MRNSSTRPRSIPRRGDPYPWALEGRPWRTLSRIRQIRRQGPILQQVSGQNFGYRPAFACPVGPPQDVETPAARDHSSRPLVAPDRASEKAGEAPTPAVDEHRQGFAVDVVLAAAEQRESLRPQIPHRGRRVEPAVEPRLDVAPAGESRVDHMGWPGHALRIGAATGRPDRAFNRSSLPRNCSVSPSWSCGSETAHWPSGGSGGLSRPFRGD